MRAVNRSAVVVVPKQPFLDWLHRVDFSSRELTLTDLANDPSIYLLPECDLESELELHFKKACPKIFEDQLNGWYRAEELRTAAWRFSGYGSTIGFISYCLILENNR